MGIAIALYSMQCNQCTVQSLHEHELAAVKPKRLVFEAILSFHRHLISLESKEQLPLSLQSNGCACALRLVCHIVLLCWVSVTPTTPAFVIIKLILHNNI